MIRQFSRTIFIIAILGLMPMISHADSFTTNDRGVDIAIQVIDDTSLKLTLDLDGPFTGNAASVALHAVSIKVPGSGPLTTAPTLSDGPAGAVELGQVAGPLSTSVVVPPDETKDGANWFSLFLNTDIPLTTAALDNQMWTFTGLTNLLAYNDVPNFKAIYVDANGSFADQTSTPVPEPGTVIGLGTVLGIGMLYGRRRRNEGR